MSLRVPCDIASYCDLKLLLTFELAGDFLYAAQSDDISQTVDYDGLCHHVERELSTFCCSTIANENKIIARLIKDFSPLIKGGIITLKGMRHNAFFKTVVLL